jgi:hypothetical protein
MCILWTATYFIQDIWRAYVVILMNISLHKIEEFRAPACLFWEDVQRIVLVL